MKEYLEDFWYEWKEIIIGAILVFILIFCMIRLVLWVSEKECLEKTQYMGFESQWDRWSGCQIEVEQGKWIPLDAYYFKED